MAVIGECTAPTACGRAQTDLFDCLAGAHGPGVINVGRACPPQMRSPAMSSQGFTGLPLSVASFRHVTVPDAGLSLPASESRCRQSSAPVPRLGIILRHSVEGGRCPFASGAPARRGAHNSETLMRQPDHQSFSSRIDPEPNRRSAFIRRLSQVLVKAYRLSRSVSAERA